VTGLVFGLLLVLFAVTPWALLAARRMPAAGTIALAVLFGFALPFATLLISAVVDVPMVTTVVAVWLSVGALGVLFLIRGSHREAHAPSRATLQMAAPSLLGAAIWLIVLLVAQVRSGSPIVAWAMNGDSANNILFAREVIYRGGISMGAGENPVPLTSAVMGIALAFGRDGVPSSELLRHDVTSFAALWAALIAVTCVLAGLLATVIARQSGATRGIAAFSGAIASTLPLSWLVTGYPMQFGFFNSHIALPIVLASVIVFLSWRVRAVFSLAVLMLSATLLLAVWSPLVLLAAGLGLALLVRQWHDILSVRGFGALVAIASAAQLVAYGLVAVLPVLLATGEALGAQGGAILFPPLMLPTVTLVAFGFAVAASRSMRSSISVAVVSLGAASLFGLAILLAVASGWSYYPMKFAWLATVVMALLIPGMVLPAVARVTKRRASMAVAGVALALAVLIVIPIAPTFENGQRRQHPVEWLLASNGADENDLMAERILDLADLSQPRVLWESGDLREGVINFWLLQVTADSLDDNFQLRVYAYEAFRMKGTEALCDILGVMDVGVEVVTANPQLASQIAETCPARDVTVILR
jgi:hypothetical protein